MHIAYIKWHLKAAEILTKNVVDLMQPDDDGLDFSFKILRAQLPSLQYFFSQC